MHLCQNCAQIQVRLRLKKPSVWPSLIVGYDANVQSTEVDADFCNKKLPDTLSLALLSVTLQWRFCVTLY